MTIFVTGATGFVGSRLVPVLVARGHRVLALSRRPAPAGVNYDTVTGDLASPATYAAAAASADVVLHLAAATGKASAEAHWRTNVDGTRALLAACPRGPGPRLLFVSSIAAGFPDVRHYPYAQAKHSAEAAVRESGLRHLIVRPTAIFGAGSPVQAGLRALALAPVVPMVGAGRTLLQPIHVDDVASTLADAVEADLFHGETIDLGGPEACTIADLLHRIRAGAGRGAALTLRVPATLVIAPLRLAESAGLGRVLPVSAGQFSSFLYNGVAAPHPWTDPRRAACLNIDAMVGTAPLDPTALAHECRVFTQHLIGTAPTPYAIDVYARAHAASARFIGQSTLDAVLVALARRHWLAARVVDGYARLLAPSGLLRRKLVLVLAILETSAPHYQRIDSPLAQGPAATMAALAVRGVLGVLGAAVGCIVLLPIHAVVRLGERR